MVQVFGRNTLDMTYLRLLLWLALSRFCIVSNGMVSCLFLWGILFVEISKVRMLRNVQKNVVKLQNRVELKVTSVLSAIIEVTKIT